MNAHVTPLKQVFYFLLFLFWQSKRKKGGGIYPRSRKISFTAAVTLGNKYEVESEKLPQKGGDSGAPRAEDR